MTDEYFYIEEISPNSSEIESEKSNGDKKCSKAKERNEQLSPTDKKSQEIRLHEIEQQLEMAESRCNNLKGQVDYMKMLYNGMNGKESKEKTKPPQPNTARRHLSIDSGKKKNEGNVEKETKYTVEQPSRERDIDLHQYHTNQGKSNLSSVPQRDRGDRRACCEKDANAAVKSINNIICGITNSVNRLTQLQVQIGKSNTNNTDDHIGIQNVKCSPRYQESTEAEKPYQTEPTDQIPSTDSIKSKTVKKKRLLKGKTSSKLSMTSSSDKKRIRVTAKHTEKRTRLSTQPCGDISQLTVNKLKKRPFGKLRTISSRTLLMKKSAFSNNSPVKMDHSKIVETQEWKSDKLIELYHNSAAKIITASEDSLHNKKATTKVQPEPIKQRISRTNQNPHPNPSVQQFDKSDTASNIPQYRPQLSPINEGEIQYGGSYYRNNYELPTIASKMKQVAKSYFQNFSFRTIPFVAAKSVTPSHNLGVNIQQVLSIIKGRKPVAGISPTLAYNIELAANKLGSRPLSALVSNLGSRMNSNKTMCPLARRYPFSHLQEMAKEIPEETIEEINAAYGEETPKLPETHQLAAGDKDAEHHREKTWYSDSKKAAEKCTCVSQPGVSFNDVYNKYTDDKMSVNHGVRREKATKRIRHRPWNENRRVKTIPLTDAFTHPISGSRCSQINKREKSLKEVLANLHDEFACLNDRYDELKTEVGNVKGSNSNLILEIEKMERDLQNKEDEITMVMSLYKEVMALKQQVKVLKTRASQSTVVVSPFINRNRDYRDLNAAGHLTKLLRHIQQFQETLKNKSTR